MNTPAGAPRPTTGLSMVAFSPRVAHCLFPLTRSITPWKAGASGKAPTSSERSFLSSSSAIRAVTVSNTDAIVSSSVLLSTAENSLTPSRDAAASPLTYRPAACRTSVGVRPIPMIAPWARRLLRNESRSMASSRSIFSSEGARGPFFRRWSTIRDSVGDSLKPSLGEAYRNRA